jgi:hypothetical protein
MRRHVLGGRTVGQLRIQGGVGVAAIICAALLLAVVAAMPAAVEAQAAGAWRSQQFSLGVSFPHHWSVVEEQSSPERGDVVILGNDTSALLIGMLWDTRSPRQMSTDLVNTQKEATPDLNVVQATETEQGSILLFMQYTIHPQSGTAMLVDEKALLGTLTPGESTITIRGMVPDKSDVDGQFQEIEDIVDTLGRTDTLGRAQ